MIGFLQALFWFLVATGVLVTFHEYGHYWVGRRFDVKVLTFSFGFGSPLWSRTGRDGTQWQVAAVPLGGYVRFLDDNEAEVAPIERDRAFNRKPVWQRLLILAAGPAANLLLCLALFWVALMIGVRTFSPVVGEVRGVAAESGLHAGDRLVAISDRPVRSWEAAVTPLALAAIDRQPLALTVQDPRGRLRDVSLRLDRLAGDFDQTDPLGEMGLGMSLADDAPRVGTVSPGFPAEGRLQPGDRILRVGTQPIERFSQIRPAIARQSSHGEPLRVEFERGGRRMDTTLVPRRIEAEGHVAAWILGVAPDRRPSVQRYGPAEAAQMAVSEARRQTGDMLALIARLVTGRASTRNLSGAIGIAQAANYEAQKGFSDLLWFMGALSLVLCVMNLLPIPILDGGRMVYYLIELVSGRPVGERMVMVGQFAGLAMVVGLIGLAFYNDLVRNLAS